MEKLPRLSLLRGSTKFGASGAYACLGFLRFEIEHRSVETYVKSISTENRISEAPKDILRVLLDLRNFETFNPEQTCACSESLKSSTQCSMVLI